MEKEIVHLGKVKLRSFLSAGLFQDMLGFAKEIDENERVEVFTNHLLSKFVLAPNLQPDDVKDLRLETIEELINAAVDAFGIREEFDSLSNNLPVKERFYKAYKIQEDAYREEFSDIIKNMSKSLSVSLGKIRESFKELSSNIGRNLIPDPVIISGEQNLYLHDDRVDLYDQALVTETAVPVLSSDDAYDRIDKRVKQNFVQIKKNIEQIRRDSERFSIFSLIASSLGFVIIIIGIILIFLGIISGGILSTIAGVIPEVAAYLFFRKDKELREVLLNYHRLSAKYQNILTMIDLTETIDDSSERDRMKTEIILRVLNMGMVHNKLKIS
jgi:hypothetical protein